MGNILSAKYGHHLFYENHFFYPVIKGIVRPYQIREWGPAKNGIIQDTILKNNFISTCGRLLNGRRSSYG